MSATSSLQQRKERLECLKQEYTAKGWRAHHEELVKFIKPSLGRFLVTDQQTAGQKKHSEIINGKATWALRTLASGMMSGLTSPSRPWFRLTLEDDELAESGAVKAWLAQCETLLRTAINKSNLYDCLALVYLSVGCPGTAALHVEEDERRIFRGYVWPTGSYYLALGPTGEVDTCYRERTMTVGQVVQLFGLDKCRPAVREMYKSNKRDVALTIGHGIEPNPDMKSGAAGYRGKRWLSCWWDAAASNEDGFLRESGYDEFPIMAPRWEVTGEDVYGTSPSTDILGDVKALQVLEKRKAQMFDKVTNPPLMGSSQLRHQAVSLLPGAITYGDVPGAGALMQPVFRIEPQALQAVELSIREHEQRIATGLFADLWLSLTGSDVTGMTAREVQEKHEEKLLQLGPVVEKAEGELLDPLIDRCLGIMMRRGLLPEPPEELRGQNVKPEYISILAQAQKLVGITGVERLAGFVGNLAAVKADVLDKLDIDEMVDKYGEMLGVPAGVIRTDEDVAAIRAGRQQQQAQMAAQQQAATAVQGAKVLSETDTGGDNALTRLLAQYGAPKVAP